MLRPASYRERLLSWPVILTIAALWVVSGELVPGNSRMYDAIEAGDLPEVKRLLDSGADPNSRSRGLVGGRTERYLYSPLVYALWRNQPAIAAELVRRGADPRARAPRGGDVLSLATDGGMREVLEELRARGVGNAKGALPVARGVPGP